MKQILYWAGLVLAAAFLSAADVKADVFLNGTSGAEAFTFGSTVANNSYTFSETYQLSDPQAFFTSFKLDPADIDANFQSFVNNSGPGGSLPQIDAGDTYNVTFRWSGNLTINGVLYDFGSFNVNVPGVNYDPPFVSGGSYGSTISGDLLANFNEFSSFYLDDAALAGISEITFSFTMYDILVSTSFPIYADIASGWIGSIDGLFHVTWTASSDPPGVPEPASLLLWTVGGLSLAGASWKRRRRNRN